MPKLIMFCGGVETLTFFSRQLAAYFEEQGWNIFWYDLRQEELCARRLRRFIKPRNTCVLTFNFLGLSGESGVYDERRGYLWEQYKIPCVNIVVDHPLYYSERYDQLPDWYYQISIDRDHEKYLKESNERILNNKTTISPEFRLALNFFYSDKAIILEDNTIKEICETLIKILTDNVNKTYLINYKI